MGSIRIAKTLRNLLCVLILCISMLAIQFVQAEGCQHQWNDVYSARDEYATQIVLHTVDDSCHWYMERYASAICVICNELLYEGDAWIPAAQHSFVVRDMNLDVNNDVRVTFVCAVCDYVREEVTALHQLLSGTNQECLLGGQCDPTKVAYLTEKGIILPEALGVVPHSFDAGDKMLYAVLVYNKDTQSFQLASRVHCAVCGRPRINGYQSPSTVFSERWNGLQIMTEDYFLELNMPDNLPYQLIDQLRQEAEIM